jgi:hypothetical protein
MHQSRAREALGWFVGLFQASQNNLEIRPIGIMLGALGNQLPIEVSIIVRTSAGEFTKISLHEATTKWTADDADTRGFLRTRSKALSACIRVIRGQTSFFLYSFGCGQRARRALCG